MTTRTPKKRQDFGKNTYQKNNIKYYPNKVKYYSDKVRYYSDNF